MTKLFSKFPPGIRQMTHLAFTLLLLTASGSSAPAHQARLAKQMQR